MLLNKTSCCALWSAEVMLLVCSLPFLHFYEMQERANLVDITSAKDTDTVYLSVLLCTKS